MVRVCVPRGRIHKGMGKATVSDAPVREAGSVEYERIIGGAANPYRPGTPAARLNMILRDPEQSRSLVIEWIENNVRRKQEQGCVISPGLLAKIARRVSIESLIHDLFDVPVRLVRAGCGFERRRGEWETANGRPAPKDLWPELWDETVRRRMLRDVRRREDGEIARVNWLPLHDGRCSDPENPHPMAGCSMERWLSLFDRRADVSMDEGIIQHADPTAINGGLWKPDAEWMRQHGVGMEQIMLLDPEELEAMGVDAAALREAAIQNDGGRQHKRLSRVRMLTLILRDQTVAERLVEDNDLPTRRILVRCGMPESMARTGMMFERLMLEGTMSRQQAWDEACRRLVKKDGRRGRLPGAGHLREYVLAAERIRERYSDPPEHDPETTMIEPSGIRVPDGMTDAEARKYRNRVRRFTHIVHDRPVAERLAGMGGDIRHALIDAGVPERLARTGLMFARVTIEHPTWDEPAAWREACNRLDLPSGYRGVDRGKAGLDQWRMAVGRLRENLTPPARA